MRQFILKWAKCYKNGQETSQLRKSRTGICAWTSRGFYWANSRHPQIANCNVATRHYFPVGSIVLCRDSAKVVVEASRRPFIFSHCIVLNVAPTRQLHMSSGGPSLTLGQRKYRVLSRLVFPKANFGWQGSTAVRNYRIYITEKVFPYFSTWLKF